MRSDILNVLLGRAHTFPSLQHLWDSQPFILVDPNKKIKGFEELAAYVPTRPFFHLGLEMVDLDLLGLFVILVGLPDFSVYDFSVSDSILL